MKTSKEIKAATFAIITMVFIFLFASIAVMFEQPWICVLGLTGIHVGSKMTSGKWFPPMDGGRSL